MRRLAPALALALLATLSACGDDGKTAPRGAPEAPPPSAHSGTPSTPPPATPSPTGPDSGPAGAPDFSESSASPWAATRVGDTATWDVRVVGSDSVTKLTWRATRVDASSVHYSVRARRLDVQGATKSTIDLPDEIHVRSADPRTTGVAEALTVSGRSIPTVRSTGPDGKTTIWLSGEVPFSGLVKSTNTDVEQVLVAFGRGS